MDWEEGQTSKRVNKKLGNTSDMWRGGLFFTPSGNINRYRFPLWPHQSDLRSYGRTLGDGHHYGTILILGATPGLRDIASEYADSVIVADVNRVMLESASTLLHIANADEEIWMEGDWLDIALPTASVDAVMGDLVWWLFTNEQQNTLREKIAGMLSTDGLLISRFFFKQQTSKDPLGLLRGYIKEAKRNPDQIPEIYHMAFLALMSTFSESNDPVTCRERVADIVLTNMDNFPAHSIAYLKRKASFWRERGPDLVLQDREEGLGAFKNDFTLREEVYQSDYVGADTLPVLSWQLR